MITRARVQDLRRFSSITGPLYLLAVRSQRPVQGSGDWDRHYFDFTQGMVLEAIRGVLVEGSVDWHDTRYYAHRVGMMKEGRRVRGCSTPEQFERRLREIEQLFEHIKGQGFKSREELGEGHQLDDIRVAFDRHGRPLVLDGRHRLGIAWALGLEEIPVRVALRHRSWADFRRELNRYAHKHNGAVYQQIDHPDLCMIPAAHGGERWPMILKGLPEGGGEALDIGAHWGHYSQQLERLGYQVTAIEQSQTAVRYMGKLKKATGSLYKVVRGDVLEEDLGRFRVVLALNVFHHFIKTREGHEKLQGLLARLRPHVIIFEAHKPKPDGQMKGAFWQPEPEEFAAFVGEHAGLSQVQWLGTTRGGRKLFRVGT